jgi:hypothetical protein
MLLSIYQTDLSPYLLVLTTRTMRLEGDGMAPWHPSLNSLSKLFEGKTLFPHFTEELSETGDRWIFISRGLTDHMSHKRRQN